MSEEVEQAYIRGERRAWTEMLRTCLQHLGTEERNKHSWILEREQAISRLRDICEEFGDNDWDEKLHLADIVDKHLGKHLFATAEDEED